VVVRLNPGSHNSSCKGNWEGMAAEEERELKEGDSMTRCREIHEGENSQLKQCREVQ